MELIPGSINCSKKKSITAYDIGPMSSHRDGGGNRETARARGGNFCRKAIFNKYDCVGATYIGQVHEHANQKSQDGWGRGS